MLRKTLVFVALFLASHSHVAAGPAVQGLADFPVRTWNENDGLSVSRITAITQDHDGYLWLGTDAGLVKFDGVRFLSVNDVGGVKLPVAPIPALLSTSDRSLWIGTVGPSGLARLRNGRLTQYRADRGLLPGYVTTLLEDRAGVLWAGNASGLFSFDGDRWHRVNDPAIAGSTVLALHESRDGSVWLATRSSVFRRQAGQPGFALMDTFDIASNAWQGFSEDAHGIVWISDFREGFRRVGAKPSRSAAQRGWGVRLLHDRRGNFWVATRGQGLWRIRADHRGEPTVEFLTRQHGLATDAVQCVFEDREGNVWVGTQAGLQRLTPHRVTPLTDLAIARATALTPDGSVWVGSTRGLTRFSAGGRRHYGEAEGLPGSVVLATEVDREGVLWVATERGIARFANERFSPLVVRSGQTIQRIFSLVHRDSTLWLRDVNSSLTKVSDAGEVLPLTEIPEEFRRNIVTLADDADGNLWLGGINGRLGVLRRDGTFARRDVGIGNITAITPDDRELWLGGDDGLSVIEGDRVRTVTAAHGLPTRVRSIVKDRDGVLWVGFGSGIARLEKAEIERALTTPGYRIQYRLFNTADGAAGVPMTEGSRTAVAAPDNRLWFATSAGVTIIDPQQIGEPRHTAPAILESVTAGARAIAPVPGVTLPARTSQLQFIFTAPTLTDSMRVEFKYRLDGVDATWIDAGTNRQAAYANLGPGPYTFRVMATNGDGAWSTPTAFAFSVDPTFYQTRWFYAACALALLLAFYASWRLHIRRVHTQYALVLAERMRMSRAIHDTLLQGLAGLALQLDDLSHATEAAPASSGDRVRRMRRRVEEYIREARQSIWDLRAPALERQSLPLALREVGTRLVADRPVSLDVSVKGAPQSCSPAVEQQLLLICQEALTNAVRHGSPRRIDVELEYGPKQVSVRVSDDGRGFDPARAEQATGHYGVVSMRERAAQVRGRLTIASKPGNGTRVEAVVPVV